MKGHEKRSRGRSALAAIALAVGVALVVAAPAAAAGTYADPAGDNGPGGDVTGVMVASEASGQIIFRIAGANLSTSEDQVTIVNIDSDANPLTGDVMSGGSDYWFAVDNSSYSFEHWNGHDWDDTPYSSVHVGGGGSSVLISVNRAELGNTADFNFSVETAHWTGSIQWGDSAPNDGMFNYSLDAGGPLIQSVDVQTTPGAGPAAGRTFVVAPVGLKLPPDGRSSSKPILPETYSCTATLKGRPLAGTGTGGCTFRVPKKARGKTLSVVLTVGYQGATKSIPLAFRVT